MQNRNSEASDLFCFTGRNANKDRQNQRLSGYFATVLLRSAIWIIRSFALSRSGAEAIFLLIDDELLESAIPMGQGGLAATGEPIHPRYYLRIIGSIDSSTRGSNDPHGPIGSAPDGCCCLPSGAPNDELWEGPRKRPDHVDHGVRSRFFMRL
jgi:hypothetical protein